jgi:hypothetical protein
MPTAAAPRSAHVDDVLLERVENVRSETAAARRMDGFDDFYYFSKVTKFPGTVLVTTQ